MAFAWVDGTSKSHAEDRRPYKFLAKDLYLIIVGYAGCIFTGTLFDEEFTAFNRLVVSRCGV